MVLRPNPANPQYSYQWQQQGSDQNRYVDGAYHHDQVQPSTPWDNQSDPTVHGWNETYYQEPAQSQQHQASFARLDSQQYPQDTTNPGYGRQDLGHGEATKPYDPHAPIYNPTVTAHGPEPYGSPFVSSAPPPVPPKDFIDHPSDTSSEDRGFMGALGGAAAGGYAGHKMHHGMLGTLGGAYAGHKLEDAYKQHQQEALHGAVAPLYAPSPSPPAYQGEVLPGNFSASARNVQIDKDFDLIAEVWRIDGSTRLSSINLNSVLTNSDGHFAWCKDGNFSASAREVHLADGGQVLRAELCTMDGRWVRDSIRLDEKIENNDGDLSMLW